MRIGFTLEKEVLQNFFLFAMKNANGQFILTKVGKISCRHFSFFRLIYRIRRDTNKEPLRIITHKRLIYCEWAALRLKFIAEPDLYFL